MPHMPQATDISIDELVALLVEVIQRVGEDLGVGASDQQRVYINYAGYTVSGSLFDVLLENEMFRSAEHTLNVLLRDAVIRFLWLSEDAVEDMDREWEDCTSTDSAKRSIV